MKEADLHEWCEWFKESELLETVQILRALFSRKELFRAKMLTERARTVDESLKMMYLNAD